jgi:DNA replication protein DnaC
MGRSGPKTKEVYCEIHPLTVLVCPRCIAAEGGKTTARRHTHEELSRWGRAGVRAKKAKKKRLEKERREKREKKKAAAAPKS